MRHLALPLVAAWATAVFACSVNPVPGQEGYAYNVTGQYRAAFTADDGVTYTGTMHLATSIGGSVQGQMLLEDPMTITGSVEGVLIEDRLRLSVAFEIPEIGCLGVVTGSGTVAEGGAPVEGTVDIESDCEAPSEASFRLVR